MSKEAKENPENIVNNYKENKFKYNNYNEIIWTISNESNESFVLHAIILTLINDKSDNLKTRVL